MDRNANSYQKIENSNKKVGSRNSEEIYATTFISTRLRVLKSFY